MPIWGHDVNARQDDVRRVSISADRRRPSLCISRASAKHIGAWSDFKSFDVCVMDERKAARGARRTHHRMAAPCIGANGRRRRRSTNRVWLHSPRTRNSIAGGSTGVGHILTPHQPHLGAGDGIGLQRNSAGRPYHSPTLGTRRGSRCGRTALRRCHRRVGLAGRVAGIAESSIVLLLRLRRV